MQEVKVKEKDSEDDNEPFKKFGYDEDDNIVRVYGEIYGEEIKGLTIYVEPNE